MPDEATVQYFEYIEAIEAGMDWIQETFGIRPHVLWPIDAFGDTAYLPVLAKKYGFDSIFLARIGHMMRKQALLESKQMNFVWEGHD